MKNRSTKVLSLFAAALFIMNWNFVNAQDATAVCKPHEVTIGVRGGGNLSLLYAGSEEINKNYGFGIGYFAGLTSSYAVTNNLALVAEVNFAKLASERKDVQPLLPGSDLQTTPYPLYANYKKTEKFDYLEVPVMVRLSTGNKVKAYANVGPFIGFIASAKMETSGQSLLYRDLAGQIPEESNGSLHSFDGNKDITNTINSVNFGLTGGGGICYTNGKHHIMVDARYSIGLTNIRTNIPVNGKNDLQSIMVGLGYSYTIFK